MDALALLTGRRSCAALKAPAPEGEALETILRAALRVPDFQGLRPYEFILAKDEGLDRLGALLEQAAIASGHAPENVERAPKMPRRAPLVITVVARARESVVVTILEQRLTAGCAVMAMQMAAVALGFSGIWRSTKPSALAPTIRSSASSISARPSQRPDRQRRPILTITSAGFDAYLKQFSCPRRAREAFRLHATLRLRSQPIESRQRRCLIPSFANSDSLGPVFAPSNAL